MICRNSILYSVLTATALAAASLAALPSVVAGDSPNGGSPSSASDSDVAALLAFDPDAPGEATVESFANPPASVRPWAYYWCLKGNISKEQVSRDLANIAERGFGGLLVFDSRRYWDDYASTTHVPVPLEIKFEFMSDGWVDVMSRLVSEASRLGLQVAFNVSDSGGQLRGPFDMKELGPYELIWTEQNLNGPKRAALDFALPDAADKPYYADVAALAVRIATPVSEGREVVRLNDVWGQVAYPTADAPRYAEVVDLTDKIVDGKLDWDVPEGAWKVLRFGRVRIGEPGCVDILNAKSVENYFFKTPGRLLDAAGPLAGKTLTNFYNVSWEGVHPNWTDGFDRFFAERRRYDVRAFLPILRGLAPTDDCAAYADVAGNGNVDANAGIAGIGGIAVANRFVVDYLKTVSDAFRANCYETIGRLCHSRGVRWRSEDGGPWNRKSPLFQEADMLTFWGQNDFPQGEFWIGNPNKQTNTAYTAFAAHIYGRRDVSLESFTHMTKHWSQYPASLKPYADKNFILGGNYFLWHTYTASPDELGAPGFEYFAGTHVNSKVTWQRYVRPFVEYMSRCQLMLRQGLPSSDICVYASDKNYVAWGVGDVWNPKSDLKLPPGFKYDLLDSNVLINRLTFENGRFVLPNGTSYRLLVFDPIETSIPVDAMRKLKSFADLGAPILLGSTRPTETVGLFDRASADAEVRAISAELWGSDKLLKGVSIDDALKTLNIAPSFEGPFEFVRRDVGDKAIYFVSGSGSGDCVFRAAGKKVELWDAQTGSVSEVPSTPTNDGRTRVALSLPENGSTFVVFSDAGTPGATPFEKSPQFDRARERETVSALDGPWEVRFDPKLGGPGRVVFDKLTRWDENANPGIEHYSGTAVYSTTFDLSQDDAASELSLSLGEVRDIAAVRLNGRELGIVWTAPWEIALDGAAVAGENRLEVEITNCWRNRLIGDAALDPSERITRTNVVLLKSAEEEGGKTPAYRGYLATDELEPSGLIGPVRVERKSR